MKKTALITGGAIRVGRALAETCGELGYRLIIVYGSSSEQALEFSEFLQSREVEHQLIQCDLADTNQVDELFARLYQAEQTKHLMPVDLLINSAAIFPEE